MCRPDFFIVGAPKCGTTAMFRYLQEHPEIYLPKKEFHHFGSDLRPPNYQGRNRDRAVYLSLFAGVTTEKRIGEASVWYLYSKKAAREIKAFAPEADVIIMLRNPVEMMYSLYSLFLWVRDLTPNGVIDARTKRVLSFEEALRTQEERQKQFVHSMDHEAVIGKRVLRIFHTDAALYAEQVKRYLDVFDRDHLHFIIYDDLKADTAQVYRDTLHFLQVTPGYEADLSVVNSNRHIRNITLHRLLNTHETMARLRAIGRMVTPARFRKRVFGRLQSINVQHRPRPPMNPDTHQWLQDLFRPDVERLSALLDRDLPSQWLENAPSFESESGVAAS